MRVSDNNFVHPEEPSNLNHWSKKWGVSTRDIHDAILVTGTLSTRKLKEHLRRDSFIYHPLVGTVKAIRYTIDYIF
jgi:hypothetical protein